MKPLISLNSKGTVTVPGYAGTWRVMDKRSGFRLLESNEFPDGPRLVVNSDDRVMLETYGTLADVLGSLMGPARAANGFAVANRRHVRNRRSILGRRR